MSSVLAGVAQSTVQGLRDPFVDSVESMEEDGDGFIGGITHAITDFFNMIADWFSDAWDNFKHFEHEVVDETGMVTGDVVGGTEGLLWGLWLDVTEPFKDIWRLFVNFFSLGVVLVLLYYLIVI